MATIKDNELEEVIKLLEIARNESNFLSHGIFKQHQEIIDNNINDALKLLDKSMIIKETMSDQFICNHHYCGNSDKCSHMLPHKHGAMCEPDDCTFCNARVHCIRVENSDYNKE